MVICEAVGCRPIGDSEGDRLQLGAMARAHALHLLGFAGNGSRTENQLLTQLENDPQIGEDARMARQRIRSARY